MKFEGVEFTSGFAHGGLSLAIHFRLSFNYEDFHL